ncbi:hypothetical protein LCGC14_0459280 [marine sediment metagenome]|uniref:Uncharacterized protein n=1 Tax=marine sediment metagenome TaxID=412755 RepID=A0A0F9SKU8_9ZZZZ
MSPFWTCKGCLIKVGVDPDRVTESCIGRGGKETCHFCGHIQDHSWMRHIPFLSLPLDLQKKLGEM